MAGILPIRRKTLSNQSILWWSFVAAVTCLEYCRYGVKHNTVSQSIFVEGKNSLIIHVRARMSENTLVKKQLNRAQTSIHSILRRYFKRDKHISSGGWLSKNMFLIVSWLIKTDSGKELRSHFYALELMISWAQGTHGFFFCICCSKTISMLVFF